tara:strand:+ start:1074 stop:1256 length:183 start_codon:yes stop_codon:yes gene_type:complete
MTGANIKEIGTNKFLKNLKKSKFGFLRVEFFERIIRGPKPIRIIKKYLKKTTNEYLSKLP